MISKTSSKISASITLVILAIGLWAGIRQTNQISKLKEQAKAPSTSEAPTSQDSKTQTRQKLPDDKISTDQLITTLLDLEPYGKDDPNIDNRTMNAQFKGEIATLTPSESEAVVKRLLSTKDDFTSSEVRLIRYCLKSLSDENPRSSLELIETVSKIPAFSRISFARTASTALVNLGSQDLEAFNEWFESGFEIRHLQKDAALREIFYRKSQQSFPEAFALLHSSVANVGHQQAWAMYGIHTSLSIERAEDYLQAVRNSELPPNLKREAMEAFGTKNFAPDFESKISWIQSNDLSSEEILGLLDGLARRGSGEASEWITWIGNDLEPKGPYTGDHMAAVRNLLSNLVSEDFVKAGHLINSLPEGSKTQQYAKVKYADHLSSVNPKMAVEWFDILPDSPQKTKAGRSIYHSLSFQDPDLAEKFAAENNLYID